MVIRIDELPRKKWLLPGTAACQGCPHALGLKFLSMALGDDVIIVSPAGCTPTIIGLHPKVSIDLPFLNTPFAAAPAVASGLSLALNIRGKTNSIVVAWLGDGGAADIGFASLSGAAIRNEDILVVVSDNEAYMNTGIQASGTTPWKARTTTSPIKGKTEERKDLALLMLLHKVPYVATASIGYPLDFIEKLRRASKIDGFKFIHLHSPCPTGWRFDSSKTIEIAKLAIETGAWILWEYNKEKLKISPPSKPYKNKQKRKPIKEYLKLQGRFRHLKEEDIKKIEEEIDNQWKTILKLAELFS